jgi:nicotinamide-nucleotide amidase
MRIELICTGDEVLTGKIVNTNFAYISQKLEDVGLAIGWETTVGDDRESLLRAFQLASERADAVIVNGGLGPTVDDLSQEIAAKAAGVELVLNEEWVARMEDFFRRRSRSMPDNNRKQAMLPSTAELIDNPVGTACGFALDIGPARFFFTPGVPRELRRMLEHEIIPRLLARGGTQTAIFLKRFHSYGLGESHVDSLLTGVEQLVPDGTVKLGFRAHYPQLETKLTARGVDMDDIRAKLAPVEREVRKRLGNFIMAEDDQTLEGVILGELTRCQGSLAIVETFTGGQMAARIAPLPGAEKVFRRGIVARDLDQVFAAAGVDGPPPAGELTPATAEAVARAVQRSSGATHALAVLIDVDDGPDRIEFGGTICLAIATAGDVVSRRARILGGREWLRLGAVELGLDCLRRYLQNLPVTERTDFERA